LCFEQKKNTQTDMLEDPNHCFEDQREQNECIQLYQDPEIPLCEDGTSVFVDQIPKDELFDSIEKLLTSCSKHKNEELKFVCQCGELICLRCAIEHQDHIKEEMEETTEDDRVNIEQLVMQNQRDVQLIEESLSEVIGTMERIEKSCFNECTKILNEAKLLKAQIDRKVKKLVNEIKEITNSKLKNLQEQKEKLNKMALGIKIGNMELIDHSQLVQMKKEINRKHKTEHTDSFELYLENNKLLTNIQEPSHEANSDMVSIEHCVVSNVQENVFINMETQFTIQLKTKDGQNLRCGVEPNVIITDTQKQLVRYKMKFNEKDGLFVVNYTPQNEGLHIIRVIVDWKHLKNSPFSVKALLPSQEITFKFKAKFGSSGSEHGKFSYPFFVACDNQNNIYVSDCWNNRIQIFDINGQWKKSIGTLGFSNGQFQYPTGIDFNSKKHLIVADDWNHRVQVFDENMQFIRSFGSFGCGNGQLENPHGIAIDIEDDIIVADYGNHRIQKFNEDGKWMQTIGKEGSGDGEFNSPCGIAISRVDGKIFVSDRDNHRIQVFSSDGKFLFKFGSKGTGNGQFNYPRGLALSNCDEYLLVCDYDNHRVQVFKAKDGTFVKCYGTCGSGDGQFYHPIGICVSPSGNIIVSECGWDIHQYRVQIFEWTVIPFPTHKQENAILPNEASNLPNEVSNLKKAQEVSIS
jgi:DNA-binding beta-propeller fold protein YncE